MKRLLLLAALAALVPAGTAAALARHASAFGGVVVARTTGGVLVARSNGAVTAVHAHARIGSRVVVSGGRLSVLGRSRSARVHGVVVASSRSRLVLTAAHRLFVVRRGRRLAATTPTATLPQPGAVVTSTVGITPQGDLDDQATTVTGQTGAVQVQAPVTAVGPGTITVSVNGQPLTLQLPAGLTLPASIVGTQITLTVSFAAGQTADDDEGDDHGDDHRGATTTTTTTTPTVTTGSGHHDHGGGDDDGGGDG